MLVIQANQDHQAAQVQWVILVHQVLHFQVIEVKRVFQVQLVSTLNIYILFFYYIFLHRYSRPARHPRCQRRTRYKSIFR